MTVLTCGERKEGAVDSPVRRSRTTDLCDRAAEEFMAWRLGDRLALDRLVRMLTPMLWHVVRAYRLDRSSAEDVVQTTWVTMVRHAESIDDPKALVKWLTVTARREAWRLVKVTNRVEVAEDEVIDLRMGQVEGPEAEVLRTHRDDALWEAVRQLSERCQRLLRVVAFAERPDYNRLAGQLGMPVGSIGPTRGRCLTKLRSLLGSDAGWRNG